MKPDRINDCQLVQGLLRVQKRELERLESKAASAPEDMEEVVKDIIEIKKAILNTEQRLSEFAA